MPTHKKPSTDPFAKRMPPPTSGFDFKENPTWRIFRIMSEFVDGFQFISELKKEVTFFGSARLSEGNKYYALSRELARRLSEDGFTIITGGGPGIMEAGNRGAREGKKGESIGLNIQLPKEQRENPYLSRGIGFHYFFTRKVMLSASAQAYVFFPGGFGTLDEFFEIITLIQTKKISGAVPVIAMGAEFWQPLDDWIHKFMCEWGMTSKTDPKIYRITDSVDEALKIVSQSEERHFF
ncbi:MAG: hypothetical protein UW39_C0009G0009 [Parcubacteria group bacterium GW2011_GWC2_44_17]|nr:MAG: hypothetical protein UW39_C0009G0009 [Parcubacteria group bacterium GW2011_GWC2_44_17]KKT49104.1 MAG: hypothetical protein UW40_C0026G0005 [Parcubacteria group bacterium GW2011_GWF2_44_17]